MAVLIAVIKIDRVNVMLCFKALSLHLTCPPIEALIALKIVPSRPAPQQWGVRKIYDRATLNY